jgi:hypothetical protein
VLKSLSCAQSFVGVELEQFVNEIQVAVRSVGEKFLEFLWLGCGELHALMGVN